MGLTPDIWQGEHDVEMAVNRWQKRAMAKENEKTTRMRKLVR